MATTNRTKKRHEIIVGTQVFEGATKKEAEANRDKLLSVLLDGQDVSPVVILYKLYDGNPEVAVMWREVDGYWTYNLHAQDKEYRGWCKLTNQNKKDAENQMRRHIASICEGEGWEYLDPTDTDGHKRNQERLDRGRLYKRLVDAGLNPNDAREGVISGKSFDVLVTEAAQKQSRQDQDTKQPSNDKKDDKSVDSTESSEPNLQLLGIVIDADITSNDNGSDITKTLKTSKSVAASKTTKKKRDIECGDRYLKTVSGNRTVIQILSEFVTSNGRKHWNAKNLKTGKLITVKSKAGLMYVPIERVGHYVGIYCQK